LAKPLLRDAYSPVAEGLKEAAVVEPVHPFEGGDLDAFEAPPRLRRRMISVLNRPMS
jgi:hypothetical protein